MQKTSMETKIKEIVSLEDRIRGCMRCKRSQSVSPLPSLGKGELDSEVMVVFENNGYLNNKIEKLMEIRSWIKDVFATERIYHTFLVRCSQYHETNKRPRKIAYIDPATEIIVSCLPFLLEEIKIFNPAIIFLCGDKVAHYILRSYGIYEPVDGRLYYQQSNTHFFITNSEAQIDISELKILAEMMI